MANHAGFEINVSRRQPVKLDVSQKTLIPTIRSSCVGRLVYIHPVICHHAATMNELPSLLRGDIMTPEPSNRGMQDDGQPMVPRKARQGRSPALVAQAMIFAWATAVAIACFVLTYILDICFSESGDFAFIIALAPAGLVAFSAWSLTVLAGCAITGQRIG